MAKPRAIVTGASSGIGREFAVQLAERGYRVTAVARREPQLKSLVADLSGGGHDYVVADLSRKGGVSAVADCIAESRCHLLVNNAGFGKLEPFYQSRLPDQQEMLALNCGAVMALSHAFLNQARKGDALINVSSVVSVLPTPSQPVYSASKAFVTSLSECLWEEQRSRGIHVMALCPGITETEFIRIATGGESDGENLPAVLSQTGEEVVREALAALDKRGEPVVVTGRTNRLMFSLMPRMMSRFRLLRTMAVVGDPNKVL